MHNKERFKKIALIILSLIILFFVGKAVVKIAKLSPFLFQLIFNRDINLKTNDGHINILLLGIGGKNHQGPNLTDTVIFTSLSTKGDKVTLVSIPRDLWVPDLVGGLEINVGRTFDDFEYPIDGKEEDPCEHTDEELKELATSSSQLEAFPCRYTHVRFDKGEQKMDRSEER